MNEQKRATLCTLGCRLNQSETAIIEDRLRAAGYAIVPFGEPADLCIVNTCTVTAEADAKSRKLIRSFVRDNPDAFTAVIGCYSQMGYKALAEIDGVDLILGNQEKLNVLDYAAQGKTGAPLIVRDHIQRDDFTIEVGGEGAFSRRANLKVQDGCNFMCSFCIIPFARGRARSREMSNLLDEARQLAARGVKEIVLTGVNIGTYDSQEQTVVDIVERLNEIDGVERIRISSIEPTTIPESLFALMRDPNHALVPYLHIPLQSGSNTVLGLMKRRYTREQYLDFVRCADANVPGLCIGTDIMVGAPGEGEAEFEETRALLEDSPLAYAHVFKYSARAGTPSVRLPGKVSPEEQNRRSAILRRLSEQKRRAFHQSFLGTVQDVLFEECVDGYWSGYTGNYMRVAACSSERLENSVRPVELERLCGDFILGEVQ
ncbi:MAG: tRNA (N(6)-L-threonylcarbamoyladenosine(37)-C(2))-methylthiotransferase MtaB [Candidatus Hydrogenedentes bacterium]|nr:tRNA (N(6)-L-threonylcarbamoyladenosine(37)-C(2))-methylthiotransferase MtaB [Candidatus Hydrogenedentota bacterium]